MEKQNVDATAIIKQGAVITGQVTLCAGSSIWHNAVLRADDERIVIGENSNIQDNCTLHPAEDSPVIVQENVTIGHACILHGCTIERNSLIGMGTIVMDHAVVGEGSIVGAGSLVVEGTQIPAGWLAFGRPAKLVRKITEEELAANIESAKQYAKKAQL